MSLLQFSVSLQFTFGNNLDVDDLGLTSTVKLINFLFNSSLDIVDEISIIKDALGKSRMINVCMSLFLFGSLCFGIIKCQCTKTQLVSLQKISQPMI